MDVIKLKKIMNNTINYTKGVWRTGELQHKRTIMCDTKTIFGTAKLVIGSTENCTRKHISDKESIANAYLMAASPDLYEALKEIIIKARISGIDVTKAEAALKKATLTI